MLLSARLPQCLAALPDNILRCPLAENTLTASRAPVSLCCCTLWLPESKAAEEFTRLMELRTHLVSVRREDFMLSVLGSLNFFHFSLTVSFSAKL